MFRTQEHSSGTSDLLWSFPKQRKSQSEYYPSYGYMATLHLTAYLPVGHQPISKEAITLKLFSPYVFIVWGYFSWRIRQQYGHQCILLSLHAG